MVRTLNIVQPKFYLILEMGDLFEPGRFRNVFWWGNILWILEDKILIGIGGENKWVMSLNFVRMSNHQDGDNSSEIRIQESSGGLGVVGTPGNSSKMSIS